MHRPSPTFRTVLSALALTILAPACLDTRPIDLGDAVTSETTETPDDLTPDIHGPDLGSDDSSPPDATGTAPPGEQCPRAVILVDQGDEVLPQTAVHLIGSQSFAVNGELSGFEWSVDQPDGSVSHFMPSSYVADPTFEVNVAGTYVFRLRVYDSLGVASCPVAEYTVQVVPAAALHVELLWWTPGYAGGTGSQGADLDLHFLHPSASGYFDLPYDTYWQSAAPGWSLNAPDHKSVRARKSRFVIFASPTRGVLRCAI